MKLPRLTLATAALAVAFFILPGAGESLAWDRNAGGLTSWVTALTAHLTHWDLSHLFFDLLAWIVLGSMVEMHARRLWIWTIGLSVPLVSLFVLLAAPDVWIYRGLSGLDSALFITTALMIHDRARQQGNRGMKWIAVGCILALLAKIAWEWSTGSPIFARGGDFTAVPQAHLAGALAGLIAIGVQKVRFRSNRHSNRPSVRRPKELATRCLRSHNSNTSSCARSRQCGPTERLCIPPSRFPG